MTYCLGMLLKAGLVMMADTRTNAGVDNFSSFRKLHVLTEGGDRQIYAATAGSLSVSQSVISLLEEDQLAVESGDHGRCLGEAPTAEQLLALKICDPAMGSGAFLVEVCRQLADHVVAAWTRARTVAGMTEIHGNAHLHARRLVAQRCLYGVDKNDAAVELAKLSLWLASNR